MGVLVTALACASCGSSGGGSPSAPTTTTEGTGPGVKRETTTLFTPAVTMVDVEIDYAAGAEPYVGSVKDFGEVWGLFRANAAAIFDGKKTVTFPRTLEKMEKLDVPAKNFTSAELLELAAAHRSGGDFSNARSFYVVFVDGYWVDDAGTERKDMLSVSIGDSGVIGMFKPAISAPVGKSGAPPELVEQIALIHAFGHAVGFVDNGVPVGEKNRAHVDAADGRHCSNESCAMHASTETADGANKYARAFVRGPTAVLIGQECLSDARVLENNPGSVQ